MKNALLCIALMLLFATCKKQEDNLPENDGPNDKESCQIQSITQRPSGDSVISTFYYNSKGLPDSILHSTGGTPGLPEYHFAYNNPGQLTQFIETFRYEPGKNVTYDAWHLYQYNNKGQIISDTTYVGGLSEPGTHPTQGRHYYHSAFYHTYTYDAQGRIIQVGMQGIGDDAFSEIFHETYTYDTAGNREREGYTYSAAKNINTANTIWQFLNRDYSLNSPTMPVQVNESNLPIRYETSYLQFLLSIDLMSSQIMYNCSK